jgi:hypothetical protein
MMPTVPEPLPLMLTNPEPPPLMPVAPALMSTTALSGGPPVQPIVPPLLQVSPARTTATATRTTAAPPRKPWMRSVVPLFWFVGVRRRVQCVASCAHTSVVHVAHTGD